MPVYGPVGLLATHSSLELSEWMAFERVYGPIGVKWDREVAAQQHELAQFTNYLLGAQLADKDTKNQVPKPEQLPRPWDADEHMQPTETWAEFDEDEE